MVSSGFFRPRRGGGPHPRRGCAGPGAPFPPDGGKGGGLGGVVPVSGHKKTAHHGHPGRGAGPKQARWAASALRTRHRHNSTNVPVCQAPFPSTTGAAQAARKPPAGAAARDTYASATAPRRRKGHGPNGQADRAGQARAPRSPPRRTAPPRGRVGRRREVHKILVLFRGQDGGPGRAVPRKARSGPRTAPTDAARRRGTKHIFCVTSTGPPRRPRSGWAPRGAGPRPRRASEASRVRRSRAGGPP